MNRQVPHQPWKTWFTSTTIRFSFLFSLSLFPNRNERIIYKYSRFLQDEFSLMATDQNAGLLDSSNLNNNNNNTTLSTRDSVDYSSKSKSSTMPKYFYQNMTKSKPKDLNASQNLPVSEHDLSTNSTETSKRVNHSNGKFSIQKMLRQGFSSWRTRKKPPPAPTSTTILSTPPPATISTYLSPTTSIPSTPQPSFTAEYLPSTTTTTTRSVSVDAIAQSTSPSRIIVTEQILPPQFRANSVDSVTVDFDRPTTTTTTNNNRGYIQSPWANSPSTAESLSRAIAANRTTPVQISETSNPPKIPPPGKFLSIASKCTENLSILVPPKPDINRLTPMRSNYFNNQTSLAVNPSVISSTSTFSPSNEERHVAFSDTNSSNQFKPITESTTDSSIVYANLHSFKEKLQSRPSPIPSSSSSPPTSTTNSNPPANTERPTSSPSSTPTKQSIIQDIDTTKYEEILAKEPDLTRQPEKSALKKGTGVKRRVIPVLRENQRPSPRPSPKLKTQGFASPSTPNATNSSMITNEGEEEEEEERSDEHSSSDEENHEPKKRFANVQRNDSLARFLKDRPMPDELYEKHILVKPLDERKNERENIENKLERKLSLRPRPEELEARNILRAKTQAELAAEREEKKRYLLRKLSFRPSIQGKDTCPMLFFVSRTRPLFFS